MQFTSDENKQIKDNTHKRPHKNVLRRKTDGVNVLEEGKGEDSRNSLGKELEH